jgi:hypothetical protein
VWTKKEAEGTASGSTSANESYDDSKKDDGLSSSAKIITGEVLCTNDATT